MRVMLYCSCHCVHCDSCYEWLLCHLSPRLYYRRYHCHDAARIKLLFPSASYAFSGPLFFSCAGPGDDVTRPQVRIAAPPPPHTHRVDVSFHESKAGADDVVALLSASWPKPFTTDK
jgi:hypothetical protein